MSTANADQKAKKCKLNGLYAFKEGMSTIYNSNGEAVPVTVLRYEEMVVTQVKSKENDGYCALQLSCCFKDQKKSKKSEIGHFAKAGITGSAKYVKEIRTEAGSDIEIGSVVDIESLVKGEFVNITSTSKGRGFCGSVKRWGVAGGPASHGSKFHRSPGSSGNRTWPGRVMPGKKFPGHWGDETITVKNIQIIDVIPEQNVVLVKGPVPGARNTLVRLLRG